MIRSITINKLIVEGDYYRRSFPFKKGINIISGDVYSGKSLVLKLIDYCFGDKDKINLNVQKELGQYCDWVYLELEIVGKVYTIKRHLKQNIKKVYIFFSQFELTSSYIPKTIEIADLSRFFLDLLGIPEFQRMKNKAHQTTKTTEALSFRDIFRFVYIDQHELGTNNFLNNENAFVKAKNKPTFQLLHKLISPDLNAIVQQIVDNENKIQQFDKEIEGLAQYLKERDALDQEMIQLAAQESKQKIDEKIKEKQALIEKVSQKKAKQNDLYSLVQSEVIKQTTELNNLEELRRSVQFSLASKQNLLEDYKRELEEINATKEAIYHLKSEHHESHCPLCDSIIQLHQPKETETLIEKATDDLNKKINTLNISIFQNQSTLKDTNSSLNEIKERKKIFDQAFKKFSENIEVPFMADLEVINSFISSFGNVLNLQEELLRVHLKIEEKQAEIDRIKKQLESLGEQEKGLRVEERIETDIMTFLNQEYRSLLQSFNFNTDEFNDYIDASSYMPYYNNASVFEHESGGLVMCIQIAYLGSILKKKIDDPTLTHPGFLMFDTLSKYIGTNKDNTDEKRLDPRSYEALYSFLIELSNEIQIFIVDNTPPEIARPYVNYEFLRNDLKGFINLSLNELGH